MFPGCIALSEGPWQLTDSRFVKGRAPRSAASQAQNRPDQPCTRYAVGMRACQQHILMSGTARFLSQAQGRSEQGTLWQMIMLEHALLRTAGLPQQPLVH